MEQVDFLLEIISHTVPVVEMLLFGYCFYRLVRPFMSTKRGAFGGGMAYFLMMLTLYIVPFYLDYFAAHGISVLVSFFVMCRADRRNYGQKAFLAAVFFSLRWLTSAMAEILYDNLYSFAGRTDYMAAHEDLWLPLYVGVWLFYLSVEFFFMTAIVWSIRKTYIYKDLEISEKELFMVASPCIAGAVGCEIMQYYRSFYIMKAGSVTGPYEALTLLYSIVSVLTDIVVIVFYQRIRAKQEEELQNQLFAAQMESMMHHIQQVEGLYQDMRSIRHDMANHILTLEKLYAANERPEAEAYAADLKNALCVPGREIRSGNPVTDVILQEWKKEAERNEICFECGFYFPAESKINAFDISIILNNALQNAVENTVHASDGKISVRSYSRKNAYMIEICNSCSKIVNPDPRNGLPPTSKERAGGHGYGLVNIQKAARKYCGDIDIIQEDGEFKLFVMLML